MRFHSCNYCCRELIWLIMSIYQYISPLSLHPFLCTPQAPNSIQVGRHGDSPIISFILAQIPIYLFLQHINIIALFLMFLSLATVPFCAETSSINITPIRTYTHMCVTNSHILIQSNERKVGGGLYRQIKPDSGNWLGNRHFQIYDLIAKIYKAILLFITSCTLLYWFVISLC